MAIDNLMLPDGDAVYYTEDFRHVLEDHMEYLRTHQSTKAASVNPEYAYVYRNDLFSFLAHINLPVYLHWVTMRMNNWVSPTQFTRDTPMLMLPDPATVQQIKSAHTAGNRVS